MKTSELTESDYHPFYQPYIDTLGDVELMDMLGNQLTNFPKFIENIPESHWQSAYSLGKWTIAEVLVHVLDAERVFQYRALRIGRKDQTPLPGFDQDAYVPHSGARQRSKASVIDEYKAIRGSSISLFANFDRDHLNLQGTASNAKVSVGALGFLICGHQKHHRNVIRQRYLQPQS
jgi:uncharacterized damage-inducible protein DinB